jgi:hypothetical protein
MDHLHAALRPLAAAAGLWALLFGLAHVYWAFGGDQLVPDTGRPPATPLGVATFAATSLPFLCAALFPLALAGEPGRWLRFGVSWGTVAGLLLAAADEVAGGGLDAGVAPFLLGAAAIAAVRVRFGTVPRWALRAVSAILGAGFTVYGVTWLALLAAPAAVAGALGSRTYLVPVYGAWWLAGGLLFLGTAVASGRRPTGAGQEASASQRSTLAR